MNKIEEKYSKLISNLDTTNINEFNNNTLDLKNNYNTISKSSINNFINSVGKISKDDKLDLINNLISGLPR